MEPVIREFRTGDSEQDAELFLRLSPLHFLKAWDYPSPAFPEDLAPQVVVLGVNLRPNYHHLPNTANDGLVFSLCRLVLNHERYKEPDLGVFLQTFLAQLKDMEDLNEVARQIIINVSRLFSAEGAALLVYDETKNTLRFAAVYSQDPEVEKKLKHIEVPMGQGVAGWVAEHLEALVVDHTAKDQRFTAEVDEKTTFQTRNLMAAPILVGPKLIGVLEVVNHRWNTFYDHDLPIFSALASMVGIFLEKAQLVSERKKYLVAAGKAEIANSVLHNIGNVLNSFTVSCRQMEDLLGSNLLDKLGRTVDLLGNQEDTLSEFLENDARGKQLPIFLAEVYRQMLGERESLAQELKKLQAKSHLMHDIIETQQTIARAGSSDTQDLIALIEEALAIMDETIRDGAIQVTRDYHSDKPVRGSKTKLVHVLINLIKNAIESVALLPVGRRFVRIETLERADGCVVVTIADQGMGIDSKTLSHLFSHGFTTKEQGHGFGLHFCAKAMEEMRATIEARSDGLDKGASFVLTFPNPSNADFLEI